MTVADQRTRRKKPDVRRALNQVMGATGVSVTLHERLLHAAQYPELVIAGAQASGTIRLDELDVEVTIVVRPRAASHHEVRNYREQALALLVRQSWRGHCCATVADRGRFKPWGSKSKGCEKPIAMALVNPGHDKISIAFACKQHARTEHVGALIVELAADDLTAVRKAKATIDQKWREAETKGERWTEDRPEYDDVIQRMLANRGGGR